MKKEQPRKIIEEEKKKKGTKTKTKNVIIPEVSN